MSFQLWGCEDSSLLDMECAKFPLSLTQESDSSSMFVSFDRGGNAAADDDDGIFASISVVLEEKDPIAPAIAPPGCGWIPSANDVSIQDPIAHPIVPPGHGWIPSATSQDPIDRPIVPTGHGWIPSTKNVTIQDPIDRPTAPPGHGWIPSTNTVSIRDPIDPPFALPGLSWIPSTNNVNTQDPIDPPIYPLEFSGIPSTNNVSIHRSLPHNGLSATSSMPNLGCDEFKPYEAQSGCLLPSTGVFCSPISHSPRDYSAPDQKVNANSSLEESKVSHVNPAHSLAFSAPLTPSRQVFTEVFSSPSSKCSQLKELRKGATHLFKNLVKLEVAERVAAHLQNSKELYGQFQLRHYKVRNMQRIFFDEQLKCLELSEPQVEGLRQFALAGGRSASKVSVREAVATSAFVAFLRSTQVLDKSRFIEIIGKIERSQNAKRASAHRAKSGPKRKLAVDDVNNYKF
eukprot:TRINITY_DN2270_c0_g2_i2.p1 TRINITY_DN2270_c0_g2~~TRINITY_DN2270_c0_g2_i2.p1  ORF type:complete len:457 (+),score=79.34 TRINITY_DN2270_c0_g2_i2:52-1422(+)